MSLLIFELGGISVKGCSEGLVGFGLVLVISGEVLRKQGFVLIGCCQEVGVIPWLAVLTILSIERWTRGRLKVLSGRRQQLPMLSGRGVFWYLWVGQCSRFVCFHMYGLVLFLS